MAYQDLATHYEQLRRHALRGTSSSTSVGLVVLLRQGLTAWIRACSCSTLSPARDLLPRLHTVDALPADVRSQAAVILAGILLISRPEATP
jgi:hypothetical protein